MDWLEQHNPQIDWVGKSVVVPTEGAPIHLQGNSVTALSCTMINQLQLASLCRSGALSHAIQLFLVDSSDEATLPIPATVQNLLS